LEKFLKALTVIQKVGKEFECISLRHNPGRQCRNKLSIEIEKALKEIPESAKVYTEKNARKRVGF